MKTSPLFIMAVIGGFVPATLLAIDHKNLEEHRPLRIEDAYSIGHQEFEFQAGAGFRSMRRGSDEGYFPIELKYGLAPNLHISGGTTLLTGGDDGSGDLELSALYNFNQETLWVPAFGLKSAVTLPTGSGSRGTDFEITGLVTRSIGRLSLHLNAGYEFAGSPRAEERDGRYKLVFGASYPIGAPMYTRTTLITDIFVEQSEKRGEDEFAGVEAGFRHQLAERIIVDAGVGTEFAGPAGRATFYGTAGVSVAF